MIALVPAAPAHAASANGTIAITPTSGTPSYLCVDGICSFTTTVTITGSGFPSGQDSIDFCFLPTSATPTAGCPTGGIDLATGGYLYNPSIVGTSADTVQADANGNFKVQFNAPIAYGGAYYVYAFYTPGSGVPVLSSTQTFTLQPGMAIEDQTTLTNSGIPGQAFDVIVVGMGAASSVAGEGIQLIPSSFFTGAWTGLTVGHILGADQGVFEEDGGAIVTGASTAIGSAVLPALPTGTTTVEALGLTSGTTVTAKFTTTPSIYLEAYANPCPALPGVNILSTATAAGNKLCMAGSGFAKSATIAAAGTVTVGGQTTIEAAVTTSSTGSFGPIPVTLSNSVGVGPLTVAFDGMSFNWANGNIGGVGILLGSNAGQGALTYMSETSGHVGDTVDVFGFGYTCTAHNAAGVCTAPPVVPGFTFGGAAVATATVFAEDGNGAFEGSFAVPALPTTQAACPGGTCYLVHDVSPGAGANTAPDQTFTITPEATFGGAFVIGGFLNAAGTAVANTYITGFAVVANEYKGDLLSFTSGPDAGQSETITASTAAAAGAVVTLTTTAFTAATTLGDAFQIWSNAIGSTTGVYNSFGFSQALEVDGFATTDATITVTMNGVTWATCPSAACPAVGGSTFAIANGGVMVFTLPTIGQKVAGVATPDFPGGSYSVNGSGTTTGNFAVTTNTLTILPIQAESAGVAVAPVISALSINTGFTGQTVGLLSSPTGGLHGLSPSTAYTVMWDGTTQVATFTSTAAGQVPIGVSFAVPAGTSGFHIVDIDAAGASVIYGNQLTGGQQFGFTGGACGAGLTCDLLFNLFPALTATPSLVGAGQTATVQGSGLPANTQLYIVFNSISYTSFTSTATGGVPSGVTFTVPQMQTAAGGERGTLMNWQILNSAQKQKGILQFVYGTTASLSASSGAAGTSVTLTANGMNAGDGPYTVIFNCIPNNFAPFSCSGTATGPTPGNVAIGALVPNALGSASTTITIPTNAASGTYVIQLQIGAGPILGQWALANPITFTIGAPSGVGVTTLTPGQPSQVTLQGNPAISMTYTNTLSTSITAIGYAVVTNALGQVVLYTTSETTLTPGGTQTLYFVLAGLAAGTYTVSIYAISSTGVVVSTTTSATAVVS